MPTEKQRMLASLFGQVNATLHDINRATSRDESTRNMLVDEITSAEFMAAMKNADKIDSSGFRQPVPPGMPNVSVGPSTKPVEFSSPVTAGSEMDMTMILSSIDGTLKSILQLLMEVTGRNPIPIENEAEIQAQQG